MIYAVVLVSVSAGKEISGEKGVYDVALISGLTDVDAITLSNSRLAGKDVLGLYQAGISILIAFVANLAFKLAIVAFIGDIKMLRMTMLCFSCITLPALLIFL